MPSIRFKKGYKYQLTLNANFHIPIHPPQAIETDFICLTPKGELTICLGYSWDGASGPTYDDRHNMRGSLVHDALYQLMRMGLLVQEYRAVADHIMYTKLLEDGMIKFRAKYYYWAVRRFAAKYADPKYAKKVCEAP